MSATAPADRTAALDRVDELVAGGLTVSKACAQVAEGLGATGAGALGALAQVVFGG